MIPPYYIAGDADAEEYLADLQRETDDHLREIAERPLDAREADELLAASVQMEHDYIYGGGTIAWARGVDLAEFDLRIARSHLPAAERDARVRDLHRRLARITDASNWAQERVEIAERFRHPADRLEAISQAAHRRRMKRERAAIKAEKHVRFLLRGMSHLRVVG